MRRQGSRGEPTPTGTRVPPHDIAAERALVGAMLISGDAIRDVAGLVNEADFYVPINGAIYAAILELYAAGDPVDVVTVGARLAAPLERLGGRTYLLEVAADVPASANVRGYATIVAEAAHGRNAITLAGEIAHAVYEGLDWTTRADDLADHVAAHNVVFDASTLDVVDIGPILDGAEPEVVPFWLRRNDDHALLYPGKVHDFHGEPSHGKTWVALAAVRDVIQAGGTALYVDYEDTPAGIVNRLLRLQLDRALLVPDRFRYLRPTGPMGTAELAKLHTVADELDPDLVIIDGVGEALAMDGFDENSNTEVITWGVRIARPLARKGAAVVLLDHVKKDPQGRTRGARGAGAKLALADGVSYEVRLGRPFSRRSAGFAKLIIAKDREGAVGSVGETVAHARIEPRHDGLEVGLWLEPPPTHDDAEGASARPTGLMERVSEHLRLSTAPQSEKVIMDIVHGKREWKKRALAFLVAEGFVTEEKDGRRTVYRHAKPFHDRPLSAVPDLPDEPLDDPDDPGPEPPPELWDDLEPET